MRTSIRKLPTFVCHVVDKRLAISLFSLLASSPDAAVATSYSVGYRPMRVAPPKLARVPRRWPTNAFSCFGALNLILRWICRIQLRDFPDCIFRREVPVNPRIRIEVHINL